MAEQSPDENVPENDAESVTSGRRIQQFCSFAAVGRTEAFQAIFVCRTCCGNELVGRCICSACADQCHRDHEVEYIGMGPCYCDCRDIGCKIVEESRAEAARLGISLSDTNCYCKTAALPTPLSSGRENESTEESSYIRDVFRISILAEATMSSRLTFQAKELVKHSRDTFWLDAATALDEGSLCDLELLAWRIFRQHMHHYRLENTTTATDDDGCGRCMGAEWWVQVKQVSQPPIGTSQSRLESYANGAEAVDLHYDKDEALAESFGLGLFPTLSTVTYLTVPVHAPPTLVFSRRYDQEDNDAISEMLISHPAATKHLVFDGHLLHGAPSHFALRPLSDSRRNEICNVDNCDVTTRVTFLVNLWLSHKPSGVEVLAPEVREAIRMATKQAFSAETVLSRLDGPVAFTTSSPIPHIDLTGLEDLPVKLRGKIELPFVGGKATWVDDEDDDVSDMVLVTYPPPVHQSDTLLVRFGPDLEATLQYSGDDNSTTQYDRDFDGLDS
jgi:hypothetical protein